MDFHQFYFTDLYNYDKIYQIHMLLKILEDTVRYAGRLLAPALALGFGLGLLPRLSKNKNKSTKKNFKRSKNCQNLRKPGKMSKNLQNMFLIVEKTLRTKVEELKDNDL